MGPAGADSTVAGPAGADSTVPGPPGADSTVAGPPGADSTVPGPAGPAGTSEYAQFFALMPPDNAATVAPGTAVAFPQDGPTSGTIVRSSATTFLLPGIGTYRVAFSVPVDEAGQLQLTLNSNPLAYTVYGRATGTGPIAGEALVTTTSINSVLAVANPAPNSTALTITPLAGGTQPAVASLVIQQLS
jgi:hypothetical protein